MEVIAKEMEPPISEEFARVTTDISMGINLEDALRQMAMVAAVIMEVIVVFVIKKIIEFDV